MQRSVLLQPSISARCIMRRTIMLLRSGDTGGSRLSRRTERRLITQAQQGSEEAARALVDAHKDRLFAFVWRIPRDHDEADEICQESFLRAFSSLDSF